MHIPQILERVSRELTTLGRSPRTIDAYESDLTEYFFWIWKGSLHLPAGVDLEVAALRRDVAADYINDLRLHHPAATVLRRMAAIRCMARVFDAPDPLKGYSAPRVPRAVAHPLAGGLGDLDILIDAAKSLEQKTLIALCGMAGLRISEARAIRVSDVRFRMGRASLQVFGKGRKVRFVPLAPKPYAIIEGRCDELLHPTVQLLDPDPRLVTYSDKGARGYLTRLGKANGIAVASHDLRMTFGSEVYDATKDIRTVQELLGHESVETTVRYTGITEAKMVDAVAAVFS